LGLRLGITVSPALLEHLFELLLLGIVEQSLDPRFAVLHDALRFGMAILGGERTVGTQAPHLLLAIPEDGLELHHLFRRQAEFLPEMFGHAIGVGCLAVMALPGPCSLGRVRWLSLIGRLRQRRTCGKQRAQQHRYRLCIH
jgi:hypothetical protein